MQNCNLRTDQIAWGTCPIRFDLAGEWTDTPPYTKLYGGKVVNIAANLNGQPPVQVYVGRFRPGTIYIRSIDLQQEEVICDQGQLENYTDPNSPFGLAKAALKLMQSAGVDIFKQGLNITTMVAVPKGSGLGTSSILAAAVLGTLQQCFNVRINQNDFMEQVLDIERMLTTGGGWQDQIGGVVGGVKCTTNTAGERISLDIEHLDTALFTGDIAKLWVTYYTGQTRLAKNILQEVVNRVKSGDAPYINLLENIYDLGAEMRTAISKRDMAEVGKIFQQAWEYKKQIHPSATNPEVEELLQAVAPYTRGTKLMGAGGGGYALFLARTLPDAKKIKQLLQNPRNPNARLVEWEMNPIGLRVTFS